MRFKLKTPPEYSDRRLVKRFVWSPIKLDGHLVWLEFVVREQRFVGYWKTSDTRLMTAGERLFGLGDVK